MKYKLLLLAIIGSMLNTGCSDFPTQPNLNNDTRNIFPEDATGARQPMGPNDPSCADEFGNTPLMLATVRCDAVEVERLLQVPGMDVHPINSRGEDVFFIAKRKIRQGETNCEEVLVLLEEHHEGEYSDDHVHTPYDCRGNALGDRQGRIIPPVEEIIAIAPPPSSDVAQDPVMQDPVMQDPFAQLGPVQEPQVPSVREPILPMPTDVESNLPGDQQSQLYQ